VGRKREFRRVNGEPYLYQSNHTYYFRRAVPEDARAAFDGSPVKLASLGTSLKEARHARNAELADFDRKLAGCRREPDPTVRRKRRPYTPPRDEIERGVRLWFAQQLEKDEQMIWTGGDEADSLKAARFNVAQSIELGLQAPQAALPQSWIASDIASENGWSFPERSGAQDYLIDLVVRAQNALARAIPRRGRKPLGEPDDLFSKEAIASDKLRESVSILALFEDYVSNAKQKASSVKAYRVCINHLIAFLGHDDASKVTRADIIRWKDALLSEQSADGKPLRGPRTVKDRFLVAAKGTFDWGVDQLKLAESPVRVKIRVPEADQTRDDKGLSDEEAQTILSGTLKAEEGTRSELAARARRWVPWLCAYTGARVNEMTQLRGEDVFPRDGIWCLRITPEAGGVKTKRPRTVPIHPHLVEQGFLTVAEGKVGPLFYDPSNYRGGSDGNPQYKKVGERLAKWVRGLGVDDPEVQPNHGWRHRFQIKARGVIPAEILEIITGHAPPNVARRHYPGADLKVIAENIAKYPKYVLKEARSVGSSPGSGEILQPVAMAAE
jgi:integrase